MEIEKIQVEKEVESKQQLISAEGNFADILAEKLKQDEGNYSEKITEIQNRKAIEAALFYGIPVQANLKISVLDNKNNIEKKPKMEVPNINKISNNMSEQYSNIENLNSKKKSPR